jgi:hypothetical protein
MSGGKTRRVLLKQMNKSKNSKNKQK